MNHRDITRKLRTLGCSFARQGKGSHEIWRSPTGQSKTSIPNWGGRDLSPGTISAILRDLGISRKDFDSA
ncbi:MAG: type II toxin-antitoxin system HicA family toxin [Dehalococcoidia bacterium]|nr:type II toxin-antitoxin system HicA family toxin [Dehalococcoidia bacterium]